MRAVKQAGLQNQHRAFWLGAGGILDRLTDKLKFIASLNRNL